EFGIHDAGGGGAGGEDPLLGDEAVAVGGRGADPALPFLRVELGAERDGLAPVVPAPFHDEIVALGDEPGYERGVEAAGPGQRGGGGAFAVVQAGAVGDVFVLG